MQGHNYRMPEMEAAIGIEQIKRLPGFLKKRQKNAEFLFQQLEDIQDIQLPYVASWATHNWYLYTVRIPKPLDRDEIQKQFHQAKIGVAIYYEIPLHLTPYYQGHFGYSKGMMPVSEQAAQEVLSIPVHPALTKEELQWIVDQAKRILTS